MWFMLGGPILLCSNESGCPPACRTVPEEAMETLICHRGGVVAI